MAAYSSPQEPQRETTAAEPQLDLDHGNDAGEAFARKFSNCLAGYGSRLEPNEQIMVLGLDSATPGRMSVIYYRQLLAIELLQRLEDWHSAFAWPQRRLKDAGGKKKIVIWPVSSPAPEVIAEAAYGDTAQYPNQVRRSISYVLKLIQISKLFQPCWQTGKPCSTPQCWHCFPLSMHKPKLAAAGELVVSC